jgi:TonB-dependent starch-binding outer membrane protein SusC
MWNAPGGTTRLLGALLLTTAACGRPPQPSSPSPRDSVQVGYGAQPRDKVVGAVGAMSDRDVPGRPLRIEELLRGRVPGLQVVQGSNGPSFRIRGTGSMLVDQEPLVVVDDVPIPSESLTSALAGLTPKDIKSVSVLKDVASTSIYGGRGAGGVILISTKK